MHNVGIERIQRFSRRARRYVCAYYVKHYGENGECEEINDTVSLKLVEKMVKEFKTHRAALDFDTKYIKEEANL